MNIDDREVLRCVNRILDRHESNAQRSLATTAVLLFGRDGPSEKVLELFAQLAERAANEVERAEWLKLARALLVGADVAC